MGLDLLLTDCCESEVLANCPARDEFYFAPWYIACEDRLHPLLIRSDYFILWPFISAWQPCLTLDQSFEEVSFLRIVRCRTGSVLHFGELHAKIGWSSVGYVRLLYTLSNYFTLRYQGRLHGGTAHGEVQWRSALCQWSSSDSCTGDAWSFANCPAKDRFYFALW
jgi:hypothetical protein